MKPITPKDLNADLLRRMTKTQLIEMICHVGNVANEYTPDGTSLLGDRSLSKLNLVKEKFKVRKKKGATAVSDLPEERTSIKTGDLVRIRSTEVRWAAGKSGTVRAVGFNGGYIVCVLYQDSFAGETEPKEHVIWADEVEAVALESQSLSDDPASKADENKKKPRC